MSIQVFAVMFSRKYEKLRVLSLLVLAILAACSDGDGAKSNLTNQLSAEELGVFLSHRLTSFSLVVSKQTNGGSSGNAWDRQPSVQLLSPLSPYGEDASSVVTATLVNEESKKSLVSGVLKGTSVVSATCGEAQFTDLRIDRQGTYRLIFSSARALAGILGKPLDQEVTSHAFQIISGEVAQLRIVQAPAGLRTGHVFLVQPTIAVLDIGENRISDDQAQAVTAICFPRPICDLGQPASLENGSMALVRRDAIVRLPTLGLVTYADESALGIVATIKAGVLRWSIRCAREAVAPATTEFTISVGRLPYRLAITQAPPALADSGQAFPVSAQIVAKLDQAFGWFQTQRARVTVQLFRRRYATNSRAPLLGNTSVVVDDSGTAHFTDLEVVEISSGGTLQFDKRVFFLTFTTFLIVDSVDVGIPDASSEYFLVRPGPAAKVLLNKPLAESLVALHATPLNPQPYIADKNDNLVASQITRIVATACRVSSSPSPVNFTNSTNATLRSACLAGTANNSFIGDTNLSTASGVGIFLLRIAKAGRYLVCFSSPGLAGWLHQGFILVTPGEPHHLAVVVQPESVQVGGPMRVAPVVAVEDEGGNSLTSPHHISVSLVTNGSRAHVWIPKTEVVAVGEGGAGQQAEVGGAAQGNVSESVSAAVAAEGAAGVSRATDNDGETFHELSLGGSMTFDLRHRYVVHKVKILCAVPSSRNVSSESPLNATFVTSLELYTRDRAEEGWTLARHKSPGGICSFDQRTNKTAFELVTLSNPVQAARYLRILVTGTVAGGIARVAEVDIFGGLAPVLTGALAPHAGNLSRASVEGFARFDHLLIADHLAMVSMGRVAVTPPYYYDPLYARDPAGGEKMRQEESRTGRAKLTQKTALFALQFEYDSGVCVPQGA
jgi:hypothetical protein